MLKLGLTSIFALTAAFAATTPACTAAKAAYDCNQICNRYKDCFDANYNATKCASDCRSNADAQDYATKAENCQNCIDDRSCAGSFACASQCIGIVP